MRYFLCFAGLLAMIAPCAAQDFGSFKGKFDARWMDDGRSMQMLEEVVYTAPNGEVWTAPKGLITDGASIPGVLWGVIGGPFAGKYRFASVIHDQYRDSKSRPWRDVHKVFYTASRAAIALHHAGSSRTSINYAIPFSRIVKQSPILRELVTKKTTKKEPKVTMPALPADVPSEPAQSCSDIEMVVQGEKRCLKPKDAFRDCPTCPQMVIIPEGNFMMGSPKDEKGRIDDEGPQREVLIAKPFAVGKFEVTVDQFEAFVKASGFKVGSQCYLWTGKGWKQKPGSFRAPGFKQLGNHPAACINWKDAKAYSVWLSKMTGKTYRLLSEAEWEHAARAGKQTRFSFGDDERQLCEYGNHADNSTSFSWKNKACNDGVDERTAKVGSFKANGLGLHDMHGNVWEWTQDCWIDNYKDAPKDGTARTTGNCSRRVLRGGSWNNNPRDLRSAIRLWYTTVIRFNYNGFRVSRTLNP